MGLKKLYAYVVRSYLGPLVLTFFISLFIILLQFLWKYIDDLVGKGLEATVILRLIFYASTTFVPMALPLAILLSSLMTFGNLGEHYELVAMKASGISVWKIMRPLVILSLFISALAFVFSNNVLPVANLKFQSLLYDIRQQKLAFNINEGMFYNGIENYIIRVGRKDKDGRTIYDVKIYDHTNRMGNIKVTTAQKGYMELSPDQRHVIFTLFDGYNYTDVISTRTYRDNRPFERTTFEQQRLKFDLSEFDLTRTDEVLFKNHYGMLNTRQLTIFIDSLNNNFENRNERYIQNFYSRFQFLSTLDTVSQTELVPIPKKYQKKQLSSAATDTIPDSLQTYELQYPLLNNFQVADQFNIIENALTVVRSNRNNITDNRKSLVSLAENIRKHEIAWHKKHSLSIACLILFFIGAPLGAIVRKGGLGLPVVMAVILFVIYHILSITGEKMAIVGDLKTFEGVWLSSIVLLPLGLFLTFKSTTDAALLDAESWQKFLKRVIHRLHKKANTV
ncbi:MAG: LptF/LptG family permease [Bacteroidales bacterium]|nr:LptF/LptG family permease [Bacteroidales bacterium]